MQVPSGEIALMMEAGHICRYARRFREAREIFRGVAALLPSARETAELALAAVACDELRLDEAETLCRRTLEQNPASAAACCQLAEVEIVSGRAAGARRTQRRARDLRPGEPLLTLIRSLEDLARLASRPA